MSPSAAGFGSSGFSSVFSEISLVSTGDAKRPGDCQLEVFVAEEVDGVGNKGSGDTIMVDIETLLNAFSGAYGLGLFPSTAEVSGVPENQQLG